MYYGTAMQGLASYDKYKMQKLDEIKYEVRNYSRDQLNPVESFERTFEATLARYTLSPVVIGDPEQDVAEDGNEFTVKFPYTGSPELFEFVGNNTYTTKPIYSPSGRGIPISIQQQRGSKHSIAREEAKKNMETTYSLIQTNNSVLTGLHNELAMYIRQQMNIRKTQLD
ncbi:hypothetical protein BH11BAC1_BH11BAC1_16630 [soil metagenome]